MDKQDYIAINEHRSSTSEGSSNTWRYYCCSKETQRRLLKDGLPVSHTWKVDRDGTRYPIYSTNGVRTLTAAERKRVAGYPHLPVFEREYHENAD
jgi:hypothetical protein